MNLETAFIAGDTPQHTVWDQPQDETLSIMQALANSFVEYFPGVPAYVGIGNHGDYDNKDWEDDDDYDDGEDYDDVAKKANGELMTIMMVTTAIVIGDDER